MSPGAGARIRRPRRCRARLPAMSHAGPPRQRFLTRAGVACLLAAVGALTAPTVVADTATSARCALVSVALDSVTAVAPLVPGTEVEVRVGELAPAVDELELLLALDDGTAIPVRLTPQLGAHTTRFRWVVPNLPTSSARLRVRVGCDGEEIDAGESAAFEIAPRPDLPATSLRFAVGEWWATAGVPQVPVELAKRPERVRAPHTRSRLHQHATVRHHRTSPPPNGAPAPHAAAKEAHHALTSASGPSCSTRPRSVPRRE